VETVILKLPRNVTITILSQETDALVHARANAGQVLSLLLKIVMTAIAFQMTVALRAVE